MRVAVVSVFCVLVLLAPHARAFAPTEMDGAPCRPDECAAWQAAEEHSYIKARELAEKILQHDDSSYIAHLVMGLVYHYGESNFAKGLFHTNRAMELYEAVYGEQPARHDPWRWHAWITTELILVH